MANGTLLPVELLIQLCSFVLLSRLLSGKKSLAWAWMRRILYFVPPNSDEIVHLESTPGQLVAGLKRAGVIVSPTAKIQDKDKIQLLTSGLDGDMVLVGERLQATRSNLHSGNTKNLQHSYEKAEKTPAWQTLVDMTVSACLAFCIANLLRYFFPDIPYFAASRAGHVSIICGMIVPTIFYLIQLVWGRKSGSTDWKMSWIVLCIYILLVYVILTPSAPTMTEFWNIGINNGFKDTMNSFVETLAQNQIVDLRYKSNSTNPSTPSQDRLKQLFSENPSPESSGPTIRASWLSDFHPLVQQYWWILHLLIMLPSIPIGLVIYISLQRQVKFVTQSRLDDITPGIMRVVQLFQLLAMPPLALLLWSPFLSTSLVSMGFFADDKTLMHARRIICIILTAINFILVRSYVQTHLASGRDVTQYFLSMSNNTPKRGLSIQVNLRAIAKTAYIVALEAAAPSFLLIALLLANHWLTDSFYVSFLLVTWPISIVALLVQIMR